MSQPKTKRQFAGAARDPSQQEITSFFSTTGRVQSPSADTANTPAVSSHQARGRGSGIGPKLPESVQASLLSVGMRIRKSVPEGYKTTDSRYKPWALPQMNNQGSKADGSFAGKCADVNDEYKNGTNLCTTQPPHTGLIPYCGVNKIGNLSTQPVSSQGRKPDKSDDIPSLSCSQETIDPYDSDEDKQVQAHAQFQTRLGENAKKRCFELDDIMDGSDAASYDSFPLQAGGNDSVTDGASCFRGPAINLVYTDRVIAVARKPRQKPVIVQDFSEATFLDLDAMK
ncbi:hypothetical protein Cpir12675_003585 [Ceratocystis pirilliformis]|uniref:Uncharacterized protein n=1 Tax=Ceratocystis pirilliformis TaxID=259994 RepID=A0ABR3Z479_9PEZI